MDLALIVALNLMAVSVVALVTAVRVRLDGWRWWGGVNALVLLAGAAAFVWAPDYILEATAVIFVPLVALPFGLIALAGAADRRGWAKVSGGLWRLLPWLMPGSDHGYPRAFTAAFQHDTSDEIVAALLALRVNATETQRAQLDAFIAVERDDWDAVLEATRRHQPAAVDLQVLEVRALGELGRRDEMCAAFETGKTRFIGPQMLASAQLFLFAFAGRPDSLDVVLSGAMAAMPEEAKHYWRAIAARTRDADDPQARATLETLVGAARLARTRATAARTLTLPPAPALGPAAHAVVDTAAARVARLAASPLRPLWRAYVTAGLMAANIAMAGVAAHQGGVEDLDVLYHLGALWPPVITARGEWWRLGAASFLHLGLLHLAVNLLMLSALGRPFESRVGSVRMALVYAWCALASMTIVYLLMRYRIIDMNLLVGASGAIFGLFGALAALDLVTWWRTRDRLDASRLWSMALILCLQVAFDFSIPNVSFAAHASGFLVGVLAGLLLGLIEPRQRNAGP